jgi:hypothetical protein
MLAAAEVELTALADDLLASARRRGVAPSGCGIHKRMHSFVEKYRLAGLRGASFSTLAQRGAASERIEYFLDPWNSPYWIRDHCSADGSRRSAFVYSFGPNRRRDSSTWTIAGDDLGVYLAR